MSTIILFCFATHIHKLFFSNLPQIRITTYNLKKAKIRIGYGQSVPCGMSANRRRLESQNGSHVALFSPNMRYLGRFRWLPRVSRATAENSVVSHVDRPGSTMVVPVGQMGIL